MYGGVPNTIFSFLWSGVMLRGLFWPVLELQTNHRQSFHNLLVESAYKCFHIYDTIKTLC